MRTARTIVAGLLLPALLVSACGHKKKIQTAKAEQQLGAQKLQSGDAEGAVADLTRAHRLDPKNAEITQALGMAEWAKARVVGDESLKLQAEKTILLSFEQVGKDAVPGDWRNNLGALYIDMARWSDAVVQLDLAMKDPEYRTPERVLNNLSKASLEQKKYDEAISYASRALKIQPNFCMAHMNRGTAYQMKAAWSDAIEDFSAVIGTEECKDWPEPYKRAGEVLIRSGNKPQARAMLDNCRQKDAGGPTGKECEKLLRDLK